MLDDKCREMGCKWYFPVDKMCAIFKIAKTLEDIEFESKQ